VSDLRRLLPPGFAQSYWDAFGEIPPRDFLEAYELLADALYFGTALKDETGKITGVGGSDYFFGEPRLFGLKKAVDARLAAVRSALLRWTATRAGEGARRPRPRPNGRDHLAPPRGARDRSAAANAGAEEA
jgi:hypothetical protein